MGLVTESCVRLGEDKASGCWSCDTTARGIDAGGIIEGAVEGGGGRFEDAVADTGVDVVAGKDEDGVKGATAAAAAAA
jgi:hypothetical protein